MIDAGRRRSSPTRRSTVCARCVRSSDWPRLAEKYTTKRLEAAGRRAMHFATPSYRSVKNIPVHELNRLPPQQPAQPEDGQIQFRFAREHGYFDADHAVQTRQESGTPAWTN